MQPTLMEYLFKDSTVKLQDDELYRHIIECYGSAAWSAWRGDEVYVGKSPKGNDP